VARDGKGQLKVSPSEGARAEGTFDLTLENRHDHFIRPHPSHLEITNSEVVPRYGIVLPFCYRTQWIVQNGILSSAS
jgi:hypothetical protein